LYSPLYFCTVDPCLPPHAFEGATTSSAGAAPLWKKSLTRVCSFQKELKINVEILGAEHSEVAITYQAMADFFSISSKVEDALTYYKLSLKILENRPFPRVAAELQVNTLPLKRRRSLSISFFLKMKCRLTYMRMSD
jgi:hypothetical protein